MRLTTTLPLLAAVFLSTASPAQPPSPAPAVMPEAIRRYSTDEQYISRFAPVEWSAERLDRMEAFHYDWLARLDALDYAALAPDDRIDFHLLRSHVRWSLDSLALERRRLEEMEPVLPFRTQIQALEIARVKMDPCNPKAAAASLSDAAAKAKKIRERVTGLKKKDPEKDKDARKDDKKEEKPDGPIELKPTIALRAAGAVDSLVGVLDRWARFYDEFLPEFDWWTRKPREEAQKELRELARKLREEIAGVKGKDEDPLVGDPIGREALLADIRGELLAYSPEELIAIGERELAWCEGELTQAATGAGFKDWKEALAKVKDAYVPPGEQAAFVRDEARAIIKYLKDHDLVTIPALCEASWRLEMHSVERQKTLPYAVYGGQYMGVSYAAASMSHDDKLMSMRGNNRHFTHIVAPHELIPGHHLQGFVAGRERTYRALFRTPFLIEGWALYWEFRLWELGWAGATGQDPAMDRIGMLFWRMHRAARIIVSLKFHLGEMSPQQMVDFLVDRVGHERSGATAEVRRYIGGGYSPLYQCGYMIGGLALHSLHDELVRPGGMSERQFNDAVLMQNSVPIEMIRAALKGESLTRDWSPTWKFAEAK